MNEVTPETTTTDVATTTAPAEAPKADNWVDPAKPSEEAPATTVDKTEAVADKLSEPAKVATAPVEEAAPESYNFTVPEGFQINEVAMQEFTPIAKELNLTNDKAQKVADVYSKIEANRLQAEKEAFDKEQADYIQAVKNDSEVGGANFEKSIALANSVITRFGGKELPNALASKGLANHPEMVKFFHNIGKVISEDVIVPSDSGKAEPTAASLIFNKSLAKGN